MRWRGQSDRHFVLRRDYPVIQGTLLVVSVIYVLMNFLIDMLYLVIDPRVKY